MQDLDELMREEEARLEAEANTPERIEQDKALFKRMRVKGKLEVRRLRRTGQLDKHGEEE